MRERNPESANRRSGRHPWIISVSRKSFDEYVEGLFLLWDKHTPLLSNHVTSIHLGEIEEDDDRRIANRGVMAGEVEAAGLAIHLEDGDVVGSLIATKEELASGVEVEAARVIPSCPFFSDERKFAVSANRKDPDAVV